VLSIVGNDLLILPKNGPFELWVRCNRSQKILCFCRRS